MLDSFINSYVFIIAFLVSIFIVYIYHPEPTIIYKHPNPKNVDSITYQKDDNTCYKYEATEVKCPSDPSLILEHPLIIK